MIRSLLQFFAGVLVWAAASVAFAQGQITLLPDSPQAGEDFLIVFDGTIGGTPAIVTDSSITRSGNQISFNLVMGGGNVSAAPSDFRAIGSINLAPGTYQLNVRVFSSFTTTFTRAITIPSATSPPPQPQYRTLTGLWWLPIEAGSALNVTQGDSGKLFALWYTYQPDASSTVTANTWYNMSAGRWITPTEWRGLLYTATGPRLNGVFLPSAVGLQAVGLMTIRASSPDSIVMDVQVYSGSLPPISKVKTLQRYAF